MLKEPYKYENRYLVGKIHSHFSPSFSCSLPDVSAAYCQTALVDESGIIRTQMKTHNRSEMVALHGPPGARPPHNSNSKVQFQCNIFCRNWQEWEASECWITEAHNSEVFCQIVDGRIKCFVGTVVSQN
jgi:hypothetical protein